MEIWRQLTNAPVYSVSNIGRFRNNITGNLFVQKIDRYGYPCVSYVDNTGFRRYRTVHRLVAETFIPCNDFKLQINDKSEIIVGHNTLCERIGYRYDRPWSTFSLLRESKFFNLPSLRVERLNKPIP